MDILAAVGVSTATSAKLMATLPFSADDTTAGSETELQVAVEGSWKYVDLPQVIEQSTFFANMMRRQKAGETSRKTVSDLEQFLYANRDHIWENSWVRFPRHVLSPFAAQVFHSDLKADKNNPTATRRQDSDRFFYSNQDPKDCIRVPISYLLKLALADAIGDRANAAPSVYRTGLRLMDHFLSDNTSPETFSFNVVQLQPDQGLGRGLARETAKRFLLTQLLIQYANRKFRLEENGQKALIYSAPHPPVRQKALSRLVSDAFYRELFMSPCLSGWSQGEQKHQYMRLCHEVLTRSQLNAVLKLKEAGIITNNLVVLPDASNISLANNGTHISLGSRRLSSAFATKGNGFGPPEEKNIGDLTAKIVEHFLPLFVGTYSAAPFRLGFTDFHPERALGFLPHEIEFTHLRKIWRRWKKKASLSFFGHPLTPFGPEWLDNTLGSALSLRGDFVPDFRLIDYPACFLSTEQSPAFDGNLGNQERLKNDLADMGVFDRRMSVYLLYRQRHFAEMGFSGFEGRHYSLFKGFGRDMEHATNLQVLITALAFKYMACGEITHRQIPDNPMVESERRQIFFGAAIGLPTFFVAKNTRNQLLRSILKKTGRTRHSRRYPKYLRVYVNEFRLALLQVLREDGEDLIETLGLQETIADLEQRLRAPDQHSCADRLTREVLEELNLKTPMEAQAEDFNRGAEKYYRSTLRHQQTEEALDYFNQDMRGLMKRADEGDVEIREALAGIHSGINLEGALPCLKGKILCEEATVEELKQVMDLLILTIHADSMATVPQPIINLDDHEHAASLHRAV
ncbi:MAG: hypothetical protein JXK94_12765 [Deltaproteobacteria bacterium]|nr:hypothetical protein [Deltaproteobacteria bacterium]